MTDTVQKAMTLLELKDAIAKAIADAMGHGMREKCYPLAEAVLKIVVPQLLATAGQCTSTCKEGLQVPDDAEEVVISLGDDAEVIRREMASDSEIADNMERAAEIIEALRGVPAHNPISPDVARDAKRYRWIRNTSNPNRSNVLVTYDRDGGEYPTQGDELDTAIDAAMGMEEAK